MIQLNTVYIVMLMLLSISICLFIGGKLALKFTGREKKMFWWLYILATLELNFLFLYFIAMSGLKTKRGIMGKAGKKGLKGDKGENMTCDKCI